MIYENFPLDIRPVADITAIFSILVGKNGRKCERILLSVVKMHQLAPILYGNSQRQMRGVNSHEMLNAEFDSGLKIWILSIFDPRKTPFWVKK